MRNTRVQICLNLLSLLPFERYKSLLLLVKITRRKKRSISFVVIKLPASQYCDPDNFKFKLKLCVKSYEKTIFMFYSALNGRNERLTVLVLFGSVHIFFPNYCYEFSYV